MAKTKTTPEITGAESVVENKVGKKRKKVSLEAKKARIGWLFVLPFVLGFLVVYCPIIFILLISQFQFQRDSGHCQARHKV